MIDGLGYEEIWYSDDDSVTMSLAKMKLVCEMSDFLLCDIARLKRRLAHTQRKLNKLMAPPNTRWSGRGTAAGG